MGAVRTSFEDLKTGAWVRTKRELNYFDSRIVERGEEPKVWHFKKHGLLSNDRNPPHTYFFLE